MAAKETIGDGGGRKYANSQFSDQNRQDAIGRVSTVVKGAASGGSNSGGVGDIDSGGGVVADSNGVQADGSDETCNAAGKAVEALSLAVKIMRMLSMHVAMRMMARHVMMHMMLRHVTMRMMAMNLTMRMLALMAMNMLVPSGTALMALVVLMTLLKVRETTQLKVRI